jgi:hypothetical protein
LQSQICAGDFAKQLQNNPRTAQQGWNFWRNVVPEFDAARAPLTITGARKLASGVRGRVDLCSHLDALTETILPAMRTLFPNFHFTAYTAFTVKRQRLGYLAIHTQPRNFFL